jgi:hypothetical protein
MYVGTGMTGAQVQSLFPQLEGEEVMRHLKNGLALCLARSDRYTLSRSAFHPGDDDNFCEGDFAW